MAGRPSWGAVELVPFFFPTHSGATPDPGRGRSTASRWRSQTVPTWRCVFTPSLLSVTSQLPSAQQTWHTPSPPPPSSLAPASQDGTSQAPNKSRSVRLLWDFFGAENQPKAANSQVCLCSTEERRLNPPGPRDPKERREEYQRTL